ncbi:MlaD family protein [Nocardia barduliensis]|uniref:MlaD family protein n=1 Tax=Nocardia barduliensis TaxID=2736643 RepID=UPI001571C2F0|nr:MlaD family protein [Nocardia barduliensis]
MSPHTRMLITLGKLAVAVVVAAALFAVVLSAIRNPVTAETDSYTAEFTDASGLHVNGDVRTKGVRIGKVTGIELVHRLGRSVAEVEFTLDRAYRLHENTILAVKYQNLTGVRFIDLQTPDNPGAPVRHLSADVTKPSFDITQLFNGLQPVLSTMSTDEINTFMDNALMLLQGDGSGLTPMLDHAQRLADLAHDREQVIATLVTNMSRIADTMGGRSPQVMEFLRSLSFPIAKAMTVLGEFPKTATFGPEFLTPVHRLITQLGLERDLDIEALAAQAFASIPDAAEALRLLPPALAGLQLPQLTTPAAGGMQCSNGVARLPTDVRVLLNGSEVVVCAPSS